MMASGREKREKAGEKLKDRMLQLFKIFLFFLDFSSQFHFPTLRF
jgi:hypothetical protein